MIASSITRQISRYKAAIAKSDLASNYWWLGISYALNNNLAEADATWFRPLANAPDEETAAQLAADLGNTLLIAAQQQTELRNYRGALILREYFQQLNGTCLENILQLVLLTDCCTQLNPEQILEWQLAEAISEAEEINQPLLAASFSKMLGVICHENISQILNCLQYSDRVEELLSILLVQAFGAGFPLLADPGISIAEYCLELFPQHLGLMHFLSVTYPRVNRYRDSAQMAQRYYEGCISDVEKVRGYYLWTRALLEASDFEQVATIMPAYRSLVDQILQNPPPDMDLENCKSIISTTGFFPYLQDSPEENHDYQNRAGQLYQACLKLELAGSKTPHLVKPKYPKKPGILRIGYIGGTLRSHSVGWLSRWLWQYHNQEKFEVFTYNVNTPEHNSFNAQWFASKSTANYYLNNNAAEIAALIRQDQIDILVDVDSITSSITYEVMARRSAPVQVTWLGWDASGCPEIDYYIADRQVLPANAQAYYSEKIWRLPQTYLAVDGFEVGTATLSRSNLNIPADAVIYFSAQKGYKLNATNVLAQMQIVQQVPNSYLLVKTRMDEDTALRLYRSLAAEAGLDWSRIRFLGEDPNEMIHRANLQIADVILDTFPYNGATTTLETLWLGIPMVTTKGEQFAARNSYAFMTCAGITEGIGESIAEYIEWGVKLGVDRALRQQVAAKLLAAKWTSPLWNAHDFTLEMEKAYQQMWQIYQLNN
jgi:predicted O-linked N-acetylglucosamine transferase (SPINDLY family)